MKEYWEETSVDQHNSRQELKIHPPAKLTSSPHAPLKRSHDRQRNAYYTLLGIFEAWRRLYPRVHRSLRNGQDLDKTLDRLDEIIYELELQLVTLFMVKTEYTRTISLFRKLKQKLGKEGSGIFFFSKESSIQRISLKISNKLNLMCRKVACKSWIKRVCTEWWTGQDVQLGDSLEQADWYKREIFLKGLSSKMGTYFQLTDEEQRAFDTLQLPVWATENDCDVRFNELAKEAHPDLHYHDEEAIKKMAEERMKELIEARGILKRVFIKNPS